MHFLHDFKLKPHDFSCKNECQYMGTQITATVEEEVLDLIDKAAERENTSRSKMISHVLSEWAYSKSHVTSMEALLKEKVAMIDQLKADKLFLESHVHALMAERERLLPPAGGSFWSRLFGRRTS